MLQLQLYNDPTAIAHASHALVTLAVNHEDNALDPEELQPWNGGYTDEAGDAAKRKGLNSMTGAHAAYITVGLQDLVRAFLI